MVAQGSLVRLLTADAKLDNFRLAPVKGSKIVKRPAFGHSGLKGGLELRSTDMGPEGAAGILTREGRFCVCPTF